VLGVELPARRAGCSGPSRSTYWVVLLISEDGARLELQPVRYQFGAFGSDGDWDANWLVIHGGVRTTTGEDWTFDDPCLTTWEARELGAWLRAAAEDRAPDGLLTFTEPNLGFSIVHTREPIVLRVHLSLESLGASEPPEGLYAYSLPLRLGRQDLLTAAHAWHEELAPFPER
jgi:hypothetical protein